MALTIKYKVSPDAVTATLYRQTGAKINLSSLPTDKVILDKSKTEHIYSDGVDGIHYSFVIETVDTNGRKNYSVVQNILYKTELGPGSTKITRGFFDFGVYGELSSEEFGMTPMAIRDYIASIAGTNPILSITPGKVGETWVKCLVNKKIIFIPKDVYYYMGPSASYTRDSLYTTRLCDANGLTDDCPIISINGNDYKYRSLCHHDTSLTGAEALAAIKKIDLTVDKSRSELAMFMCLTAAVSGMAGTAKDELGLPIEPSPTQAPFRGGYMTSIADNPTIKPYGLGSSLWPSAGSGCFVYQSEAPILSTQGSSSSYPYFSAGIPVLELLD